MKERLFGLSNPEGNHGEDVKELYYYLDATPTHSYQKMLYKYPQREFPYRGCEKRIAAAASDQPEFELLDAGVFDEDRYFDVFIEYAKATPNDMLMQVTAHNRGPERAALHLLPQLWFRNTWSWRTSQPREARRSRLADGHVMRARHRGLGDYYFHAESPAELLFCENDTNVAEAVRHGAGRRYLQRRLSRLPRPGRKAAVNPHRAGTKATFRHDLNIPPGGEPQFACGCASGACRRRSRISTDD